MLYERKDAGTPALAWLPEGQAGMVVLGRQPPRHLRLHARGRHPQAHLDLTSGGGRAGVRGVVGSRVPPLSIAGEYISGAVAAAAVAATAQFVFHPPLPAGSPGG